MKKLLLLIFMLNTISAVPFDGVYSGVQMGLTKDRLTISRNHQENNGYMEKNVSMKSVALGLHSGIGFNKQSGMYSGMEWALTHTEIRKSTKDYSFDTRHGTTPVSVKIIPRKLMDFTMAAKCGYVSGNFLTYGGIFTGIGLYKVKVITKKNDNVKIREYSDVKLIGGPLVGISFAATEKINVGAECKLDMVHKNADSKKNKICDKLSAYNVSLKVNYQL